MLVNDRNWIVAGSRHELTLDDLEARVTEEVEGELDALAERVREMRRAARAAESTIPVVRN